MPVQILDYLNAVFRQRFLAICIFVVGAVLTFWTAHSLPDVYRSTTLIMVEPQGVPESYVKATVTTKFEQRLNALNQEVLSRTRLETIIDDFDILRELRDAGMPREQLVEAMRSRIKIEMSARDSNAFRISYEAEAPNIAQQVTGRLAGLYIDENLRLRDQQVTGTTEFLESELDKVKQQLEKQEALLKTFKEQHMGELPEQRDANMKALEGLRVQLQTISLSLSAAQERKVLLEKQAQEARSYSQPAGAAAPVATDPHVQLQQLETQLQDLRGKYTDEHPDVVQLSKRIGRLRSDIGGTSSGSQAVIIDSRVPPEVGRALGEVAGDITRLRSDKDDITQAISVYQARIEATFSREQELQGLVRDYDVTQKKYATLLDKKLEAQLSQSLERRQKGERFRVLDPASLPERPTRPERVLLVLIGLGLSVVLAAGLPILLWQLDSSLHGPDDVANACALPVLAVIPQIVTPEVERRWMSWRVRVLSGSAAALVIGIATVTIYAKYIY